MFTARSAHSRDSIAHFFGDGKFIIVVEKEETKTEKDEAERNEEEEDDGEEEERRSRGKAEAAKRKTAASYTERSHVTYQAASNGRTDVSNDAVCRARIGVG